MLLETVSLNVSPRLFDLQFSDFMYDAWDEMKIIQYKFGGLRLRYEIYYEEAAEFPESWVLNPKRDEYILVAEIDRTIVDENHIEIRIAASEAERLITQFYINTFYYFLYEKYGIYKEYYPPKQFILEGELVDSMEITLAGFIHELFERNNLNSLDYIQTFDFVVPNTIPPKWTYIMELLPAFYTDPIPDNIRNTILIELQKRLQPVDKLPGSISLKKKKTGRPGLSEEELLYRRRKAAEAINIQQRNSNITLKELVKEINWDRGISLESKTKLLRTAIDEYKKYKQTNPTSKLIKEKKEGNEIN
jgi:hypothetical protein